MRELESVFRMSTCGVSPFEVWQQTVWAILVNDCSFPHVKAYLAPRARAAWRCGSGAGDREHPRVRAQQILLFPRLVKTKSVAKPKWEAGRNTSSYCPNACPWRAGVEESQRGAKRKQHPRLKEGKGEEIERILNPSPNPMSPVRGTRKRSTIYALAEGKEESSPRISRALKNITKKPPNEHSHIQPLLEMAQREGWPRLAHIPISSP